MLLCKSWTEIRHLKARRRPPPPEVLAVVGTALAMFGGGGGQRGTGAAHAYVPGLRVEVDT